MQTGGWLTGTPLTWLLLMVALQTGSASKGEPRKISSRAQAFPETWLIQMSLTAWTALRSISACTPPFWVGSRVDLSSGYCQATQPCM